MKSMVSVEYKVTSKKNGKVIIENNGWYDSKDSAKVALSKRYPASRYAVTIK